MLDDDPELCGCDRKGIVALISARQPVCVRRCGMIVFVVGQIFTQPQIALCKAAGIAVERARPFEKRSRFGDTDVLDHEVASSL